MARKDKIKTGLRKLAKNYQAVKALIYAANGFAPLNLGNPSAFIYAGLDIAQHYSDAVKNSPYPRLIKALGAIASVGATIRDLSFGFENPQLFARLPFDASLAYQLTKDTLQSYRGGVVDNDYKTISRDARSLIDRLSSKDDPLDS